MAVAAESSLKAGPDLGKLAGMSNRIVQVTKFTSRTGAGQMVVAPTKGVSVDDITAMLKTLAGTHGVGTYKFEVFDEGSTEKDVWTVKLGGDPMEGNMAASPGMSTAPFSGAAPEGLIPLGNGYFYNPELGLLTMPGRAPVRWRPDEPLPDLGRPAPQPAASPWGSSSMAGVPPWLNSPGFPSWGAPGWGSLSATSAPSESSQIEELKTRLAEAEARRREDAHRSEMTELRTQTARMFDEMNKRFEMLVSKLSERPAGPTPEFTALQAELVSMKSSTESQAREDRLRGEFQAQQQRFESLIRELGTNKADPMMGFLGQIMTTFQQGQASTVQAMRDTTAATTEKLSGSVMGPMQMMQMMQMLRDNPADKAQQELFSTIFTMMQGLLRTQAELNTDNTPPWVNIANMAGEQIGGLAQALLARQQPVPQQPQYMPPQQQQRRPPSPQQRPAAPGIAPVIPITSTQPAPDPRAVAAQRVFGTGGTPGDMVRAAAAATTGLYAAVRTPAPAVNGTAQPAPAPAAVQPAAAANGAAPSSAVVPDQVIPAPARRGRRRRVVDGSAEAAPAAAPAAATAAAVAEPESEPMPEPPAAPVVRPIPNPVQPQAVAADVQAGVFANVTPEVIRETVAEIDDPTFFGPLARSVLDLRVQVQNGLPPEAVVNMLVQVPAGLRAYGAFPPALELYNAGHFDILLERLLPQTPDDYRAAVAAQLAVRVGVDDGAGGDDDGDEDDDDGDDDDEGDEGAA